MGETAIRSRYVCPGPIEQGASRLKSPFSPSRLFAPSPVLTPLLELGSFRIRQIAYSHGIRAWLRFSGETSRLCYIALGSSLLLLL
jgi:hypothetical protein